ATAVLLVPVGDEQAVVGQVVALVDGAAVLATDHPQRHADPASFRAVRQPRWPGPQPGSVTNLPAGQVLDGKLGGRRRATRRATACALARGPWLAFGPR